MHDWVPSGASGIACLARSAIVWLQISTAHVSRVTRDTEVFFNGTLALLPQRRWSSAAALRSGFLSLAAEVSMERAAQASAAATHPTPPTPSRPVHTARASATAKPERATKESASAPATRSQEREGAADAPKSSATPPRCMCKYNCGTHGIHTKIVDTDSGGFGYPCSCTPLEGNQICAACQCNAEGCRKARYKGPYCYVHREQKFTSPVLRIVARYARWMPLPMDLVAFAEDPRAQHDSVQHD